MAPGSTFLAPGYRPLPPGVHALTGARVVVKPGEVLEKATIVIRDGRIESVGTNATAPADARVWPQSGRTIYAGFIDLCVVPGSTNPPISGAAQEPALDTNDNDLTAGVARFFGTSEQRPLDRPGVHELELITPEYRVALNYTPDKKTLSGLRELGFTSAVMSPAKGLLRGTSALVALGDAQREETILKPDVFHHAAFEASSREERAFPMSLMGAIAAIRQAFFDAQYHFASKTNAMDARQRPLFNASLQALESAVNKEVPVCFEPGSVLMVERAGALGRELGLRCCILASGQEWRRPELARAAGAGFIVPLNFPSLAKLPDEADWEQVKLDALRAWDWAPENPAILRSNGCEIALTTYGLKERKDFRRNLQLAMDRGLSEDDALAALTTVPAKLCGMANELGTIEPGKLANLTIIDGPSYFDPDTKVAESWINGRVYREPVATTALPGRETPRAVAQAAGESTPGTEAPREAPEKTVAPAAAAPAGTPDKSPAPKGTSSENGSAKPKEKNREELRLLHRARVARSPLEGRGPLVAPASVLISGATVWTCGPQGRLEHADLLIEGSRIQAVGQGLNRSGLATEPLVIDGKGMHVTPGLIDAHSHTAILGAVNESSLPSSAMVRIEDVVNSETDNLHQQLAGGVTAVNLLHGSANPIGGQSCLIKLRDGLAPGRLVFEGAPQGIKFALGENVKQAGWGDRYVTRFPQTRMGVKTFIANRFEAARQYLQAWETHAAKGGPPPRRDLELEALGEVLQGKRWIHCHAYRQDEILMMLRLAESQGIRIATFDHVLEGYKVADELARHGAGATTFSDWWAYKFEVYDAIPYNGSLLRDRGVLVSFNSDSSELARRLNQEAAKAVKYGGTDEIEALKFVTLNPAKQLRVDHRVGSLEPGKDADFAIWSGSPLGYSSVCLQTWVDGKQYFERAKAAERGLRLATEREALVAKARKFTRLQGGGDDAGASAGADLLSAPREKEFEGIDRHCLEEK